MRRPGIDGPSRGGWGRASKVDNLNDLLSGEGIGSTGSGSVSEHATNHAPEVGRVSLDGGKLALGSMPASAPLDDGLEATGKMSGHGEIAHAGGSGQDDANAEGEGLGRGMLA